MMLETLGLDDALPESPAVARRPYESDRARIAAVYGLPSRVAAPRVLELRAHEDHDARLFRASQVARVNADGRLATAPDGSFDLVVLHRTLDRLFGSQHPRQAHRHAMTLLESAASLLGPAGAVVGSVGNPHAGWHPGFRGRSTADGNAWLGARRCEDMLAQASLERAEIFGVHPSADAPLTILSLQSQSYRQHALRELRRRGAGLGRGAYALRALWHATGLGRYLHRDLMFWAFRT
jgi:hypothetical protein